MFLRGKKYLDKGDLFVIIPCLIQSVFTIRKAYVENIVLPSKPLQGGSAWRTINLLLKGQNKARFRGFKTKDTRPRSKRLLKKSEPPLLKTHPLRPEHHWIRLFPSSRNPPQKALSIRINPQEKSPD
jgi:hypothetical protein